MLRDSKDDALAYSMTMRSLMGIDTELEDLGVMVAKRPQNYSLRGLYADALLANGKYKETIETMNEVQRILGAADNRRSDFDLRILEGYQLAGNAQDVKTHLDRFMENGVDVDRLNALDNQRLVRLLISANRMSEAKNLFEQIKEEKDSNYQSSKLLSEAYFQQQQGQVAQAIASANAALDINPYLLPAYQILEALNVGNAAQLSTVKQKLQNIRSTLKKI